MRHTEEPSETGHPDVARMRAAKRALIVAARRVVVMVDHTKLGRRSAATVASLAEIDVVVTDDGGHHEDVAALASWRCERRLAYLDHGDIEHSGTPGPRGTDQAPQPH